MYAHKGYVVLNIVECSTSRSDERLWIPGWNGDPTDDSTKNKDDLREEPERLEDRLQRIVVRWAHAR